MNYLSLHDPPLTCERISGDDTKFSEEALVNLDPAKHKQRILIEAAGIHSNWAVERCCHKIVKSEIIANRCHICDAKKEVSVNNHQNQWKLCKKL